MKIWPYAAAACLCLAGSRIAVADVKPTAVFAIGFDDTSLQGEQQGPRADEQQRLAALDQQLHDALAQSGCCTIVDLASVAGDSQGAGEPSCNGCELDLARKANADISVTGWIQKVSNLILNINIVARNVSTGSVISAGSVDIRGNTNESWSRGLFYLLRNRLHPSQW